MPKTYITKQEKMNDDLSTWLIGSMKVQRVKQGDVAKVLGISQQALSFKLKQKSFKYEDLVGMFGLLQPDAETLMKLMGVKE